MAIWLLLSWGETRLNEKRIKLTKPLQMHLFFENYSSYSDSSREVFMAYFCKLIWASLTCYIYIENLQQKLIYLPQWKSNLVDCLRDVFVYLFYGFLLSNFCVKNNFSPSIVENFLLVWIRHICNHCVVRQFKNMKATFSQFFAHL